MIKKFKATYMLKTMKLIAAIILLLSPLASLASNEPAVLTVRMKSGVTYDFMLSERPVITFNTKHLLINADDFSAVYDDVESLYFTSNSGTGIDAVEEISEKHHISIAFTDGHHVTINGCGQSAYYAVYALDGRRVSVDAEHTVDGLQLDFGRLIPGIYVISINSQSFKIRTR